MNSARRTAFIISDRTGITAETMAQTLLTQFDDIDFEQVHIPFINTVEKADQAISRLIQSAQDTGQKPLVFGTVIDDNIRKMFQRTEFCYMDFVDRFISPLERELGARSNHSVGKAHSEVSSASYKARIEAMHFALDNDDGAILKNYDKADVIMIGVSRSGKTPTCLYLALHFGIFAANYPITEEDMENSELPSHLEQYRHKVYALSIDAEKLSQIRSERRANSRYASLKQCEMEVKTAERFYRDANLQYINSTTTSIEEIATRVVQELKLVRRFF